MIRIDAIWLATEALDMRAGTETALVRVVAVFCAYLFANRRATRIKVLVRDGFGVWLAARRLNQGKFHWPDIRHFKLWYLVSHGSESGRGRRFNYLALKGGHWL